MSKINNIILKIDYKKTKCPICNHTGEWVNTDFEKVCRHCGCVIETPYNYTAGRAFNQHIEYHIVHVQKNKQK